MKASLFLYRGLLLSQALFLLFPEDHDDDSGHAAGHHHHEAHHHHDHGKGELFTQLSGGGEGKDDDGCSGPSYSHAPPLLPSPRPAVAGAAAAATLGDHHAAAAAAASVELSMRADTIGTAAEGVVKASGRPPIACHRRASGSGS